MDWEENRQNEIRELTGKGILPAGWQAEKDEKEGVEHDFQATMDRINPMLMGQAAGAITEILPAKDIMEEMVATCIEVMRSATSKVQVMATANL
jgi:NAD(P)H-dependent flavin oxidoreductase YrpB (nitropropane dioxygenase family)